MEKIDLSEQFSIYKFKYDFIYKKEFLIERAYQCIKLNKTHRADKNNFFYVPFRCNEFDYINDLILNKCLLIHDLKRCEEFGIQNWIYRMTSTTTNEIYHTHIELIEGDNRIDTDWTFCFYIQIPKEIEGDEGKISFLDENNIEHLFLPEEGDIFIFPANLLHTPKLVRNCEVDRLVYAGNISLNPLRKINDKSFI